MTPDHLTAGHQRGIRRSSRRIQPRPRSGAQLSSGNQPPSVSASGDLLIHTQVFQQALADGGGRRYNFVPMLAEIRPYIRGADLAVCQVETPMSGPPFTGYPVFNTPPALATAAY